MHFSLSLKPWFYTSSSYYSLNFHFIFSSSSRFNFSFHKNSIDLLLYMRWWYIIYFKSCVFIYWINCYVFSLINIIYNNINTFKISRYVVMNIFLHLKKYILNRIFYIKNNFLEHNYLFHKVFFHNIKLCSKKYFEE